MSEVPPDVRTAQEPGDLPGTIEAHFLIPRDCWAALERFAARHQMTHSVALVDAVALAHYLDLELTSGSRLVTRRPDGKFYELFFPWLQGNVPSPASGSIAFNRRDSGYGAATDDTAAALPLEWSDEEEDIRREIRLDNLAAERELARMRNQQRIDEARRLRKRGPGFWRRWRRNLFK